MALVAVRLNLVLILRLTERVCLLTLKELHGSDYKLMPCTLTLVYPIKSVFAINWPVLVPGIPPLCRTFQSSVASPTI